MVVRPAYNQDPEQIWVAWTDDLSSQHEIVYRTYNIESPGWDPVLSIPPYPLSVPGGSVASCHDLGLSLTTNSTGSIIKAYWLYAPAASGCGSKAYSIYQRVFNGSWQSEGAAQIPQASAKPNYPISLFDNPSNIHLTFFDEDWLSYSKFTSNWSPVVHLDDADHDIVDANPWIALENGSNPQVVWYKYVV
jgi:hypothetical protein